MCWLQYLYGMLLISSMVVDGSEVRVTSLGHPRGSRFNESMSCLTCRVAAHEQSDTQSPLEKMGLPGVNQVQFLSLLLGIPGSSFDDRVSGETVECFSLCNMWLHLA